LRMHRSLHVLLFMRMSSSKQMVYRWYYFISAINTTIWVYQKKPLKNTYPSSVQWLPRHYWTLLTLRNRWPAKFLLALYIKTYINKTCYKTPELYRIKPRHR